MGNVSWLLKDKIPNSPPGRMGTLNKLEFHQGASKNPGLTGLVSQEAFQSLGNLPTRSAKVGEGPSGQSRLPFHNPSCVDFHAQKSRVATHYDNLDYNFVLTGKRSASKI
jgi:hypothetical protein